MTANEQQCARVTQGHPEEDIQGSQCQTACRSGQCTLAAEFCVWHTLRKLERTGQVVFLEQRLQQTVPSRHYQQLWRIKRWEQDRKTCTAQLSCPWADNSGSSGFTPSHGFLKSSSSLPRCCDVEFENVDILNPHSLQFPSLRLGQGHTDSPLPSLLHYLGFILKRATLHTG